MLVNLEIIYFSFSTVL